MTTQEIATRYFELASEGKWMEIHHELHGDSVQIQEPEHAAARGIPVLTKGKSAVLAKITASRERIERVHSQECSKPSVAANYFSLSLKRDLTIKDMPRMTQEEICLFQVADGKIVSEQFFY